MLQDMLLQYGCTLADPDELYTDLFWLGDHLIQREGEYRSENGEYKGNPMIYVNDAEKLQGQMKRYILLEDTFLDQLHEAQTYPSNLINGVTYFGKKKDKEHADKCFGMIFDLDNLDDGKAENFLYAMQQKIYPDPNYIVISKSGIGLHLYYLFDEPIRLYPKIKVQLKELKYALTSLIWNPYTSYDKKVQYQSYDQSFMVAGTTDVMKAFKCRSARWAVRELSGYVRSEFDESDLWIESKYTLDQAKEKFPEWYEKVIENNEKMEGTWTCKRDLYDWWKRKLIEPETGASYGHRFWCVMMLAIYAIKCNVSFDELEKDAHDLIPFLDSLNKNEPFTKHDVKSALECYDISFKHFPIDDIAKLSAIPIQKNKRNGRKQEIHLERARAVQLVDYPNFEWRNKDGAPTKEKLVRDYAANHPEQSITEIARALNISRPTVYKYLGKGEKTVKKENTAEVNVDFMTADGILIERAEKTDKEKQLERMMAYRDMMEKMRERTKK